ncbi:hypothetical protein E2320_013358 [Naja naja]|nr:hypothetical protein E2320_013358 [Naja naja]
MDEVKISPKNSDNGLANPAFELMHSQKTFGSQDYPDVEPLQEMLSEGLAVVEMVSWRAVLWGLGLQFALGLFIIRTEPGFQAFQWLGNQIQLCDVHPLLLGSHAVYNLEGSAEILVNLYLNSSFVLQTEAPLLIRPYLGDMTRSEIHAIDASSLIAASVMAAPCALAMAKLVYPEVEKSQFQSQEGIKIACGEEKNVLEAAGNGASVSVGLVANVAANLIAFLAVLAFINAALSWLGGMVNLPQLSFQLICSYVLMPLAFLLGASWEEAFMVAEMLGVKFFLNEFVAYQQLATYKKNRLMGLPEWDGSQKQWISPRAETIVTFALCGFANQSSIGIMLGGLRILYVPREVPDCLDLFSSTTINSTSYSLHECCKDLFSSVLSSNGSLSFGGIWENLHANTTQSYLQKCCDYYSSPYVPGLN